MRLHSHKVAACILARMDSQRLPGKVLEDIGGVLLLEAVVERASMIREDVPVVVATTSRPVDNPICDWAKGFSVNFVRGESTDVASRLLRCARMHGADAVIRLNGDSPFLDPSLIRLGLQELALGADLVTNLTDRSYPYGISVEIIQVEALAKAIPRMSAQEREHVTPLFYKPPHLFNIRTLPKAEGQFTDVRLVVDDRRDLEMIRKVVAVLGEETRFAGYVQCADAYRSVQGL